MILWLDHKIFGSGHGMATPFWDGRFYWLSGQLYVWSGWLGAQLASVQWTHPKAHERRTLCGREFKPFRSERRWGRVWVSWAWVDMPADITAANAEIRRLQSELGEHYPRKWSPATPTIGEPL